MDISELMIGNWVVYYGDVYFSNPIRVEGMDISTGSLITSDREDVGFDGIEPIPLTDEILKKNGFAYFHKNYASISREHPFMLRMDKWPEENGFGGIWTICDIIEIRYTHQLQNALKLCGIKKEIIV